MNLGVSQEFEMFVNNLLFFFFLIICFLKKILFMEEVSQHKWGRGSRRGRSRLQAAWGNPMRGSIPGPCDHDLSQRQMLK